MEPDKIINTKDTLKTVSMKTSLIQECRAMLTYSFANGKTIDARQVAPLHKADEDLNGAELIPVHNYLVSVVKPASPGTLVLFMKNRQSNRRFKFLGPLPIVRQFMLLNIFSLLAVMLVSLSPHVNVATIQLSMLQGQGIDQFERLTFLLACSSVGASFYALFKMNGFISKGTFAMKYAGTYWIKYVLGLVAGLILSELFIVFMPEGTINQLTAEDGLSESKVLDSASYLAKPILAILGGFSASLFYQILNRVKEAVSTVFKGSQTEAINQLEERMAMEGLDKENKVRSTTAHQLLALKSDLVKSNVDGEVLDKIDDTLGTLLPNIPLAGKAMQNPVNEPTDTADLPSDPANKTD
jgi:hypothetical protein